MTKSIAIRTCPAGRPAAPRRGRRALVAVASALSLGACDFEVTNPGPVQDQFLDDQSAFVAQVNGMGLALGGAMNYLVFHGGIVTREIFPTGQAGQFGVEPQNMNGFLTAAEQGAPWSQGQQARWLAEQGVERFKAKLPAADFAASPDAARAYLWVGYSNRLLGENMCVAVIDGGAEQPSRLYLERAQAGFTSAIEVGTAAKLPEVVTAARAGRAAVRVHLGDWTGAVADAALVPTAFKFQMNYYNTGDEFAFNRTAWASMSQPYLAHTTWNTVYEDYFTQTNDPRVSYRTTAGFGSGAMEGIGRVNWWPQTKYADRTAAVNLSSGREMRLIEAEAMLRNGDWQGALNTINELRSAVAAPTVAASNATEAWTLLKRERGIELWLEARRVGDLRRWKEGSTPGELDALEVPGAASYLKGQDLCFPVSQAEIDTNPNIG